MFRSSRPLTRVSRGFEGCNCLHPIRRTPDAMQRIGPRWSEAPGWCGSHPRPSATLLPRGVVSYALRPPRPRHGRVPPLLTRSGSVFRSPPPLMRRGGAKRRGGVVLALDRPRYCRRGGVVVSPARPSRTTVRSTPRFEAPPRFQPRAPSGSRAERPRGFDSRRRSRTE